MIEISNSISESWVVILLLVSFAMVIKKNFGSNLVALLKNKCWWKSKEESIPTQYMISKDKFEKRLKKRFPK